MTHPLISSTDQTRHLVILICLVVLLAITDGALAREVSISGTIKDSNNVGAQKYLALYRIGMPYIDVPLGLGWGLLGYTQSHTDTGSYVLKAEIGEDTKIIIGVRYELPNYFLYHTINVEGFNSVNNVDFSFPTVDKESLSLQIRLTENGRELNYSHEVYMISVFQQTSTGSGQFAIIYDQNYRKTKNQFFGLPDGQYRVYCKLAPSSETGNSKTGVININLPIDSKNKILDIPLH